MHQAHTPGAFTGTVVMQIMRNASFKQRVFGVIAFLSALPLACVALTFMSMERSSSAQSAMESAKSGAILLERINGDIYAVVMESRGIYMSPDWKTAEPFAKNLLQGLLRLKSSVETWKRVVIESEQAKVDELAAGLEQFIQFRTELVRLAREVNTEAAREFGDNEANRTVRSALNKKLTELTKAYLDHEKAAEERVADVEKLNLFLLVSIASLGILAGALGTFFVHRTVIMLVNRMRVVMMKLADGDLDAKFEGVERKDEIGDFARALASFKKSAIDKLRLEKEAQAERDRAETERQAVEAERREADISRAKAAEEQSKAMEVLALGLTKLAHGDLTARLDQGFTASYQQIKNDFNATIERLHNTLKAIASTASDVTGVAAEISSGTTELSQRTEQQATSLEESSASLEQISATVRKNAENAQAAKESAAEAHLVADKGRQVVSRAVEAMAEIETASHKIANIIGVIDEIARQTNLLALNAAVEAARAGEAGRGFAVVASEVRSLAQRSSQAANDIKGLITNSNGQVAGGVKLVNRAGSALNEIVTSIKKVATLNADIAAASGEQTTDVEQLNKALSKMDEMTQQNSSLVEQNAAMAKALEEQAQAMDDRVAFFKLAAVAKLNTAEPEQPKHVAQRANKVRKGPVGHMQAALKVALDDGRDWKEF